MIGLGAQQLLTQLNNQKWAHLILLQINYQSTTRDNHYTNQLKICKIKKKYSRICDSYKVWLAENTLPLQWVSLSFDTLNLNFNNLTHNTCNHLYNENRGLRNPHLSQRLRTLLTNQPTTQTHLKMNSWRMNSLRLKEVLQSQVLSS